MPTTFVTALIDLRDDRTDDKSLQRYAEHFHKLAATGIPIHCFISPSALATLELPRTTNVFYDPIELESLELYKCLQNIEYTCPVSNTPKKDTRDYMILQNAKTEFVRRVIEQNIYQTSHFAWIDFGIFHVFKQHPDTAAQFLQILAYSTLQPTCLFFPGCWEKGAGSDGLFERVNWRFCGGFFLGDRESLLEFCNLHLTNLPLIVVLKKRLVWEVNFWHFLELYHNLRVDWFAADHNERIICIPQSGIVVAPSEVGA